MGRGHFYVEEERLLERVMMLKSMIGEQEFHRKPCPLLLNQLNKFTVLCEILQSDVSRLAKSVETASED